MNHSETACIWVRLNAVSYSTFLQPHSCPRHTRNWIRGYMNMTRVWHQNQMLLYRWVRYGCEYCVDACTLLSVFSCIVQVQVSPCPFPPESLAKCIRSSCPWWKNEFAICSINFWLIPTVCLMNDRKTFLKFFWVHAPHIGHYCISWWHSSVIVQVVQDILPQYGMSFRQSALGQNVHRGHCTLGQTAHS